VDNFRKVPGNYKFFVKYDFGGKESWTVGAPINKLTRMETDWSNELVVTLEQEH
jgi:hypothetical protein